MTSNCYSEKTEHPVGTGHKFAQLRSNGVLLQAPMRRPAQTTAEKMIKVDHVGENGAVNIYRAQYLASRIRAPKLLAQLRHFQDHEEEHREIFRAHLHGRGIRRCISYHISGLLGFILGFITGIIGPIAIYATTYAVENIVLSHLEHQLDYLKTVDNEAYDCVKKIVIDEQEHHDAAEQNVDHNRFLNRVLIKVVKFSTECVIRFGMR